MICTKHDLTLPNSTYRYAGKDHCRQCRVETEKQRKHESYLRRVQGKAKRNDHMTPAQVEAKLAYDEWFSMQPPWVRHPVDVG